MAGRGPPPKSATLRQRRNRTRSSSVLPNENAPKNKERKVPKLPERDSKAEKWHPKVIEWWTSVWTSPMAAEFLGPDVKGGLYGLAELYQQRWSAKDAKQLVSILAEIRLQEVRFGLSPIDRRRLQWEVEKGEQAEERTTQRRKTKRLKRTAKKDPREVLKVV